MLVGSSAKTQNLNEGNANVKYDPVGFGGAAVAGEGAELTGTPAPKARDLRFSVDTHSPWKRSSGCFWPPSSSD